MTRECHVRICERLEVKLLRPTRHFGMKAHVGVDSKTKMIHSVVATAANVADCTVLPELLHGEETKVWGDQAYRGQTAAIQTVAPVAQDMTHKQYRFKKRVDEVERAKNRNKSRVRSKVEHVFAVLKLQFGFVKVRYRGLTKNANRLFATCALVNLFLVRRKLLYRAA
jgi:transposase, IS5 family